MSFSRVTAAVLSVFVLLAPSMNAQQPAAPPAWVERSNQDAQVLLKVLARFNPEAAARFGVSGVDEQVIDLQPNFLERERQALRQAQGEIERMLAEEKDPAVRQDLEIMIKAAKRNARESDLEEKYELLYVNLHQLVFFGTRALLDDQVAPERRQAALVRLRKYTGMEPGSTSIVQLTEERSRERLKKPGLMGPFKGEMEKNIGNEATYLDGIGQLFQKYKIAGYEEPYARLKQQMAEYHAFVEKELLPRARTDFRLPPEMYAFRLEQVGIEMPPDQLAAVAHASFNEIQNEMMALAPRVAREKGFHASDYRDVIRELKKEQWPGPSILPNYEKRIAEIEQIIHREHLVTLPQRPMEIKLASEAESAATPAPNMRPPRLIGNTGEHGVFVLPLRTAPPPGSKTALQFDDFTYDAAAWTLVAHEGRPGHELQFDSMTERGVSVARALFSFNSVNVEGWGLYSEAILKPFMPADGQLISLQARLQRAARAFLDPELQAGRVTPEEANRILREDVCLSEAMANQEVERYTFRSPAQAPSYFYGYTQLMRLRADTEKSMGPRFDQERFHDFVLAQGLIPPPLLRQAVFAQFVPQQHAAQGN
ncbi:MAG TPA: DUF885 domain-containing protein [Terriglobales bacterium]|nr:DUF885 domain-containing protein [Terriglobales bacterium]